MFNHNTIQFYPEPIVVETDRGRLYNFGAEKYPSITTVLAKTKDTSGLDEWRKRVGEEEANRISRQSTKHGTELHLLVENLLYGNEIPQASFKSKQVFNLLSRIVHKRITTVYGIECALRSDSLKVAGRTDLVCDLDGIPTVVDWKTSKEPGLKPKEYIVDYYLQGTFYGRVINESKSMLEVKQGALFFCNPFGITVDIFQFSEYNELLNSRVKEYYSL